MVVKNKILTYVLLAYLSAFCRYATADEALNILSMSGSQFKACNATFSDFEKMLGSEYSGESELDVFLSDIKNYTIEVTQDDTRYFVTYTPKELKTRPLLVEVVDMK